jgi:hypothetical protein
MLIWMQLFPSAQKNIISENSPRFAVLARNNQQFNGSRLNGLIYGALWRSFEKCGITPRSPLRCSRVGYRVAYAFLALDGVNGCRRSLSCCTRWFSETKGYIASESPSSALLFFLYENSFRHCRPYKLILCMAWSEGGTLSNKTSPKNPNSHTRLASWFSQAPSWVQKEKRNTAEVEVRPSYSTHISS